MKAGSTSNEGACAARGKLFLAEIPETEQPAGQELVNVVSLISVTTPAFGS
jgi:hypothetical protein